MRFLSDADLATLRAADESTTPLPLQAAHGFTPLGPADGAVKTTIFGGNAARLYGLAPAAPVGARRADGIDALRTEYQAAGGKRSNLRYGYVAL